MQSMQKFNDGYSYLLVCIDVFSKYAWVLTHSYKGQKGKNGQTKPKLDPQYTASLIGKFLLL